MLPALPLLLCVPSAPTPQDPPLLELQCAGVEALFPAAKDAGLRRALALAGARLEELPEQVDLFLPPALLDLGARALLGPLHLRVNPVEDEPPFSVQVEAGLGDAAAALAFARELVAAFEGMGVDIVSESATMWRVDERPPGWIGARGDEALFAFGELADPPEGVVGPPLPGGVRAALSGQVDAGNLLVLATDGGRDLPALLAGLGTVDFSYGTDGERGHATLRIEGGAALVTGPTDLSALRLVPPDATWASVGASNFALVASLLTDEQGAEPVAGILARLDHDLGDNLGSYVSRRTGGGGLLSTVYFAEARSAERLEELWATLPEQVNAAVSEETDGMVAVRRSDVAGAPLLILTFPGLPIPVEPTLTHDGSTLFLGLTPQAAIAARAHALSRGPGIGQHPGFRAQLPPDLDGAVSIAFIDTPALMGTGYGPASLLGSALANAVRSAVDEQRDAGLVFPSFAELSADAKPIVVVTRVVGDDLVLEARLDRSLAVNLAGTAGAIVNDPTWVLLGGSVATLLPRIARARRGAQRAKAMADLRAIEAAIEMFAIRNGGRFPDHIEVLVAPDEHGNTYLRQRDIPLDPWGNEYMYDPPSNENEGRVYTYGADGIPGGLGENADISNEEWR